MKQNEVNIGFIGLGKMGLPMAKNLIKAGYAVAVSSRNENTNAEIADLGGRVVNDYATLFKTCEMIVSILPSDAEIEAVFSAKNDFFNKGNAVRTLIEMSSASGQAKLDLQQQISDQGLSIAVLDAPVSGGVAKATSGELTIMIGGEAAAIASAEPILQVMGEKLMQTGALGSASNVKMINQLLNAAHTAISSEMVILARKLNLDLDTMIDVISASSGASWILRNNIPKFVVPNQHPAGFMLKHMKKDVDLAAGSADQENLFLPLTNLVRQLYQATCNKKSVEANYTVIADWLLDNQGVEHE